MKLTLGAHEAAVRLNNIQRKTLVNFEEMLELFDKLIFLTIFLHVNILPRLQEFLSACFKLPL